MKCPSCGYLTFDDVGKCKKCGADLRSSAKADTVFSFDEADLPAAPGAGGQSGVLEAGWRLDEQEPKAEKPSPPRPVKTSTSRAVSPPPPVNPPREAKAKVPPPVLAKGGEADYAAIEDPVFQSMLERLEPILESVDPLPEVKPPSTPLPRKPQAKTAAPKAPVVPPQARMVDAEAALEELAPSDLELPESTPPPTERMLKETAARPITPPLPPAAPKAPVVPPQARMVDAEAALEELAPSDLELPESTPPPTEKMLKETAAKPITPPLSRGAPKAADEFSFGDLRLDMEEPLLKEVVPEAVKKKAGDAFQSTAPEKPPVEVRELPPPEPPKARAAVEPEEAMLPLRRLEEVPKVYLGEEPAGFPSRAAAFLVDNVAVAVVLLLFVVGAGFGLSLAGARPEWLIANAAGWPMDAGVYFFILGTLISAVYFISSHWLRGSTPGKKMNSLKVVDVSGGGISFGDAVFRWLGYLVSAAPAGLGFLWALFSRDRLTWHDRLCGTMVVRSGQAEDKSA